MAKYDMAWKELFDIDPELSAEGKKVMRALQSRRVWPQKDFLGLMQGVVPGQIEAVKAELEELGYVVERTEHEFVESWPNSRLFAKHDDTDLETYNPGPMRNISDLVDFLTKTKQLPEGDILSRRNAYRFFDSVFAQLDTDETIQLALMGVLQGGDVEARKFREHIKNVPCGAVIKTTKRIFTYYDDQPLTCAEKGIFNTNVYDLETDKPQIYTTFERAGVTNIFIDWANAHESGDDGYYLQMPITDNKDAALFLCALIARSN